MFQLFSKFLERQQSCSLQPCSPTHMVMQPSTAWGPQLSSAQQSWEGVHSPGTQQDTQPGARTQP
jgi:hypothetical protein